MVPRRGWNSSDAAWLEVSISSRTSLRTSFPAQMDLMVGRLLMLVGWFWVNYHISPSPGILGIIFHSPEFLGHKRWWFPLLINTPWFHGSVAPGRPVGWLLRSNWNGPSRHPKTSQEPFGPMEGEVKVFFFCPSSRWWKLWSHIVGPK